MDLTKRRPLLVWPSTGTSKRSTVANFMIVDLLVYDKVIVRALGGFFDTID